MKILYIDLAAAAFPQGRDDGYRSHCVRIAALLEEDGEVIGEMCHLIKPDKDWHLGESAHEYHRATGHDFADHSVSVKTVATELTALLQDVMIIVSHNTLHHQRLLRAIFTDAGMTTPPDLDRALNVCTMKDSTDICMVRLLGAGRWKPPKLREAFKFFTGADMRDPIDWYTYAQIQVRAARAVYQGIQKRTTIEPKPMDSGAGPLFDDAGY
jgi:hypothetical protein